MRPPRLIKTFSENLHANNFAQGTIILRCLNYFRMREDERGDDSESTVKHSGREGMPTTTTFCNDALILSLWTPSLNWEKECNKFGKHHVEVIDSCTLFSEIQARLKNILLQDNHSYFGKVDYMDYGGDASNPEGQSLEKAKKTQFYCEDVYLDNTPGFLEDGSPDIECLFIKRKKFQEEKESRMVFLLDLSNSKGILGQHENIQVKLCKKETEYECTWVEVILSNLPAKFFKLVD